MHLPGIWLFWTVTLALLCAAGEASTAAFTGSLSSAALWPFEAARGPFRGPVFVSGPGQRSEINWGISEESLPLRKLFKEIFYFHVLYFFVLHCIFLTQLERKKTKPSSGHCGHHVHWNGKLNTDVQWLSFTEHHVSSVLCLNSDITVEQSFSSISSHCLVWSGMKGGP